ncbi:MAG: AAA family ATPase [Actinomycetaceae bacterium]|nr:AAA family ATPase [Actinomycetaceae bacterium]
MTSVRSNHEEEIRREQAFVDSAYGVLDQTIVDHRQRQREAQASEWRNSPQALTERDAFVAHWGDEAARLESVGDHLVFGRIDDEDEQTLYIGRIGLRDNNEQILIDWRAPVSRRFYQATAAQPLGIVRRRHIQTRQRRVTEIEDEFLADLPPDSTMTFQGEGALMHALSQARDGRMSDIVSTIQAEQDEIIRRAPDGLFVIQGGPGTGKTAVALHRAAYLLYSERERLENSGVLVIGPSKVFLQYIDRVLPSLGETGVVSTTLADLLPGVSAPGRDEESVREIKGRIDWIEIAKKAVRSLERVPEDTELAIASYRVCLRAHDVRAARTRARRSGKPHNEAWEGFALELMDRLAQQMDDQVSLKQDLSWYYEYIRGSLPARRAINLAWLPMSGLAVLERLYSSADFLAQCAPQLSPDERALLYRPRGSALTESDIPILDELEELLGPLPNQSTRARDRELARQREIEAAGQAIASMELGGGLVTGEMLAERASENADYLPVAQRALKDRTWAYGHVIVDEAQELSPLAWHVLLRRCPSRSFTVTGDLDQRSGAVPASSWEELLGPAIRALSGESVLTVSYRTPASILNKANALMLERGIPPHYPLIAARDVDDAYDVVYTDSEHLMVRLKELQESACRYLDETVGEAQGRIAIIVPDGMLRTLASQLDVGHTLTDRMSIMTPTMSKGLEFDTVIIVEPTAILDRSPGDLYVAMTRPTHRLHMVTTNTLPHALAES